MSAEGHVSLVEQVYHLPVTTIETGVTAPTMWWSAARIGHSLPEINVDELPVNVLVMMRSTCRSVRQRGRVVDDASSLPGQLGLLPRGDYGRWRFEEHRQHSQKVMHVFLRSDALERLAVECGLPPTVELRDKLKLRDRTLAMLMQEIDRAFDQPVTGRLYMDALVHAVAARLLEHHTTRGQMHAARGGLAPWQVRRTQEAMAARISHDISLDDLATIAGCSPTHFSRAFKASVGMPPFEWLQQLRIERAKELLATDLPLAHVALAVGFAAQPQFTTAFGRATGITPGAWRRERRR